MIQMNKKNMVLSQAICLTDAVKQRCFTLQSIPWIRGKDETALGECPIKSEKGNQYTHFYKNINCLISFDSCKFVIAAL